MDQQVIPETIRYFIVEDYHLIRMGLVSALREFTHLICIGEFESAEDALLSMQTTTPDVLILDLGLPNMNGVEMTEIVREKFPQVKIIILTSHNQPEEVLAALGAGANAYALKDIKPKRLAQVIETVFEGAAWLDPAIASIVMTMVEQPANTVIPSLNRLSTDSANAGSPMLDLTEREKEVLQQIVQGKSNQEISEVLHISIHTTKAHVGNILAKLSVSDRLQAVIKVINENII